MSSTEQLTIFTIGIGGINPAVRVEKGEITFASMQEAAERLKTDEFYEEIDKNAIPNKCVDGRGRLDGNQELGPNAAGGTFSVVMADALTTNRYRAEGEKAPVHAAKVYNELKKMGFKIGGHDADSHSDKGCGCGAEDVLDSPHMSEPSIIRYMIQRGDDIRTFLSSNGIEVDDGTHKLLLKNATRLFQEGYATNGAELRDAMESVDGETAIETLTGPHFEFNLALNTQSGTTLNRDKLREAFGNEYQTFGLDIWALENAAKATSLTEREVVQKFAAMLYYNVATAAVLSKDISLTIH